MNFRVILLALTAWTLAARGQDLSDPALRAARVEQLREQARQRQEAAWARARQLGLPVRGVTPGGRVFELQDFVGNEPKYYITHNLNAAISTGANLIRNTSPFNVNGTGLTAGVWDGGAVRASHQEFGARVTVKDGASAIDHATHVGGTIGAAGVNANALGFAPGVAMDSYNYTSDISEMTGRAASYPGEPGKLYVSNHSYGFRAGWETDTKTWWGSCTLGVEDDFGKYSSYTRDMDNLAYNAPYYLAVWVAGNDRNDNPVGGDTYSYCSATISYNAATHPPGDGLYKNGYDTIEGYGLAKNVLTVGSVHDAVTSGTRDLSKATMSNFSGWGPTDDGRVKPDLVANGESLWSSTAASVSSYGTFTGTSMAAPNVTGTAILLADYFDNLFPGHALRASTLKALLLHTADDLGPTGPDYQFGWGLLNAKAAADLLQSYAASPGNRRILEGRLTTAKPHDTFTLTASGGEPLRVTLGWTDPPGTATTSHDSRTLRLVNHLDLFVVSPAGTTNFPYVLDVLNPANPATFGKNNYDNTEQVFLAAPVGGVYTIVVESTGALQNNEQYYSLLISGGQPVVAAPPPVVTSISPASGSSGDLLVQIGGSHFLLGASLKLIKTGEPDRALTGLQITPDFIRARLNLTGLAAGSWHVQLTNPDGQTGILSNGFTVIGPLWQDHFEGDTTGWSTAAAQGSTLWTLSTAQSQSPTHSFFSSGAQTLLLTDLISPPITVPAGGTQLQFSFWHRHDTQTSRDGGVLEFSLDGGPWFDVAGSGSGASFASGGYNSTISSSGPPGQRSPLAGRPAWSGNNGGFTQVIVNLNSATYAGHSLRARWRFATDGSTSSTGWYVDDIALSGLAANGQPDADGDGVSDDLDNCPNVPNPDQADLDNDDLGDACDPCVDADGDGYHRPGALQQTCPEDCDDNNPHVFPGAVEICNGADDNCDGLIDEGVTQTYYEDADRDGYGNPLISVAACAAPTGYVADHTDCNDTNPLIHPGRADVCNGTDDNCDGVTDPGCENDDDGDGQTNAQEFLAGTNPADPESVLRIVAVTLTNNTLTVTWTSVSNKTYDVWATTNLIGAAYGKINVAPVPATGTLTSFPDPAATATNNFYRIQVRP